jgi:serine protease
MVNRTLMLTTITAAMLAALAPVTAAQPTATLTQKQARLHGMTGAAGQGAETRVSRLIVKLHAGSLGATPAARASRVREMEPTAGVALAHLRELAGGASLLSLGAPMALSEAKAVAARLARDPAVAYAEPDIRVRRLAIPNEPRFLEWQWNLFAPTSTYTGYLLSAPNQTKSATATGGANLPPAWDLTTGSNSVVVAVIDTGIVNHPDLNGVAVPAPYVPNGRFVAGYDFISADVGAAEGVPLNFVANDGNGRDDDPTDPGDWVGSDDLTRFGGYCGTVPQNSSWHGTHVAGVLSATANNSTGIAGVAWNVRVQPVRAVGKCGGTLSDIAEAMRWSAGLSVPGIPANATPASVINVSLGGDMGSACPQFMQEAVDAVTAVGAVVVAAAGNDADLGMIPPANCRGVIGVTAHVINGENAEYANVGSDDPLPPQPAISAPGGGSPYILGAGTAIDDRGWTGYSVWSTVLFGNTGPLSTNRSNQSGAAYAGFTGTSAASPHVAGVAALVRSVSPFASPNQVRDYIVRSARSYPEGSACAPGGVIEGLCGAGLLDADGAVRLATGTSPGGPSSPPIGGGGGGGALPPGQLLLLVALLFAARIRRRE